MITSGTGLVGLLLPWMNRVLHEVRDPVDFLLKTGRELARPVLEKDDEAKREEDEK